MQYTLSNPRLGLQARAPAASSVWASRVFRSTPSAVRQPRAPATGTGCNRELCSASAGPHLQHHPLGARTTVVPKASHNVNAVTAEASTKKQWWKANADLWEDVHDDASFREAINSGDKLVLVDFFATWCHGCEKAYPELCKLAQDSDIRKNFKFVKVCIDELRALSKRENIKALPMLQIYKPGQGALVQIDVPMSKIRHLRHNLQIITMNPGMKFQTDPNGFVLPIKDSEAAQLQQKQEAAKQEAAKLAASQGGLFSHLMSMARGSAAASNSTPVATTNGSATTTPSKGAAATGASASTTATAVGATTSSSASSNGNWNGKAAVAAAAAPSSERLPGAIKIDQHAQMLEKQMFLNRHKADYGYGGRIDELYQREVGCRMRIGEHYLDYTGSSVYCQSQLEAAFTELRTCMFGNPHSANPSSSLTSERVEEVRDVILRYFNADPTEYLVVFTRSATGALKLVGETFPWGPGGTFRYLRENHNSVLGIREYALQHGAGFQAVDEKFVETWLAGGDGNGTAVTRREGASGPTYNLFAFPAEDNFAGVKYPLRWVEAIKKRSTDAAQWRVLIDAAAYVPTQPLDLRKVPADFVSLSFYKMFGYPTGLGALVVRTAAVEELRKVFWGGGTVALATSEDNFHVLKCRPSDKLEDGTVNFLDVIALKHGFNMLQQLGGIQRVQAHVAALTEYLYGKLSALKHSNGQPLLAIFGKHHFPNAREVQGGILNFEVLKPDGSTFSYKTFEREAADAGFHVRTGAECNPGACYNYLGVKEKEVEALAGTKEGCEDDVEFITVERPEGAPAAWASSTGPKVINSEQHLQTLGNLSLLGHPAEVAMKWVEVPLGSVRVSLGYMSTFEDCYAISEFIRTRYVDRTD